MKKIVLASAALLALAVPAAAADLSPRAYHKAPAYVAAVHNWTGFYLGAFGGYGWNSTSGMHEKGAFGGGSASYLRQTGNFVYGIDAEIAGADIKLSASHFNASGTARVNSFGSVAARLGFAVDKTLFYGKVGYGWTNHKIAGNIGAVSVSDSKTSGGIAAGAGIEHAFAPNWSVKGEYLWQQTSGKTYFNVIPLGSSNLQTVKLGVNYRFGN